MGEWRSGQVSLFGGQGLESEWVSGDQDKWAYLVGRDWRVSGWVEIRTSELIWWAGTGEWVGEWRSGHVSLFGGQGPESEWVSGDQDKWAYLVGRDWRVSGWVEIRTSELIWWAGTREWVGEWRSGQVSLFDGQGLASEWVNGNQDMWAYLVGRDQRVSGWVEIRTSELIWWAGTREWVEIRKSELMRWAGTGEWVGEWRSGQVSLFGGQGLESEWVSGDQEKWAYAVGRDWGMSGWVEIRRSSLFCGQGLGNEWVSRDQDK